LSHQPYFCEGFFKIGSYELLAGLALNCDPPDLWFLRSWDYRREPPVPCDVASSLGTLLGVELLDHMGTKLNFIEEHVIFLSGTFLQGTLPCLPQAPSALSHLHTSRICVPMASWGQLCHASAGPDHHRLVMNSPQVPSGPASSPGAVGAARFLSAAAPAGC
jgi:hypothetical protein